MITDEEIIILREMFPAWIIIRAVCKEFDGEVAVQALLPFPEHPPPVGYRHYHLVFDPKFRIIGFDEAVQILKDSQEMTKKSWPPHQPAPSGEHYQVALFHG